MAHSIHCLSIVFMSIADATGVAVPSPAASLPPPQMLVDEIIAILMTRFSNKFSLIELTTQYNTCFRHDQPQVSKEQLFEAIKKLPNFKVLLCCTLSGVDPGLWVKYFFCMKIFGPPSLFAKPYPRNCRNQGQQLEISISTTSNGFNVLEQNFFAIHFVCDLVQVDKYFIFIATVVICDTIMGGTTSAY